MKTSHYTRGVTSVMWSSLIASPHGLCISDRFATFFLSFCLAAIPASCVEIEQAAFITTGFPLLHPLHILDLLIPPSLQRLETNREVRECTYSII